MPPRAAAAVHVLAMARKASNYRWSRGHRARLKFAADELGKDHTELHELAMQNFYGMLIRKLPLYITDAVPVVDLEDDDDAGED